MEALFIITKNWKQPNTRELVKGQSTLWNTTQQWKGQQTTIGQPIPLRPKKNNTT
jgi:hypothetical protein